MDGRGSVWSGEIHRCEVAFFVLAVLGPNESVVLQGVQPL